MMYSTFKKTSALFLFFTIINLTVFGNHHEGESHDSISAIDTANIVQNQESELYNPVPDIMHHISDAHEWHFWGEGENSVTLPLPIILWTEKGLVGPFLSNEFHHNDDGHHIVEKKDLKLIKAHGKIYVLNPGEKHVNFDDNHHVTNASSPLDFSITKKS